jgi:hypothetical protein
MCSQVEGCDGCDRVLWLTFHAYVIHQKVIAHEREICHPPKMYSFTGDQKDLTSLLDQYVGMLCFFENNILTEGMFVTHLFINVEISV